MTDQGSSEEVQEPENSTVDDWFGQNAARDQEKADQISAEAGSEAEAERRFAEEADGKERYDAGHGGGDRRQDGNDDAVGDARPS